MKQFHKNIKSDRKNNTAPKVLLRCKKDRQNSNSPNRKISIREEPRDYGTGYNTIKPSKSSTGTSQKSILKPTTSSVSNSTVHQPVTIQTVIDKPPQIPPSPKNLNSIPTHLIANISSDDEFIDINESLQRSLSLPQKVVIPERSRYVVSSDDDNRNETNEGMNTLERRKKVEKILCKNGQMPSENERLHAALAKEASTLVKQSLR